MEKIAAFVYNRRTFEDGEVKMAQVMVCALYKFVALDDYADWQEPLQTLMERKGIRGTLLVAPEGINGTVAGTPEAINELVSTIRADRRFGDITCKVSYYSAMPFNRSKVKLKREIVTMGVDGIDPRYQAGTYVRPEDWNKLIEDPEVLVVDTRNDYEVAIGSFKNAVNPHTETFREFPQYARNKLDPKRYKKVAMFCTGGIRCEKSTALLRQQGFEEVYHLEGGILNYLERMPPEQSKWQGECFVFDSRIAVDHSLQKGHYDQCFACRRPITEADKQRPEYQKGISCHHCYHKLTEEQKARFAERERQSELARARGEAHIGSEARETARRRKQSKHTSKHDQDANR